MKIRGNCLCGKLSFELLAESGDIYQCHCSKCRKLSGSSSNANLVISQENFVWKTPPNSLRVFVMEDGWEAPFCKTCGSKAPLLDSESGLFYVPAGLLEESNILKVTAHKNLGSRAGWDVTDVVDI